MEKEIIINSSEEMINLGERIGNELSANTVITMKGDLGAGKTTLTKGIAKGLGITKIVNSPTFTIMKTYSGRLELYHLDVYRIDDASSDFELEEYFDDGGVCVIEWADQIKALLPNDVLEIEIYDLGNNSRKVILKSNYQEYENIISKVVLC